MSPNNTIHIINTILALLAIPPSFYLILNLWKERLIIVPERVKLNRVLIGLFCGIAVGSFLNAVLSVITLCGGGKLAHEVSPYRSMFINSFFLVITWMIYYVSKEIGEKNVLE
jgi:hypothetical protein